MEIAHQPTKKSRLTLYILIAKILGIVAGYIEHENHEAATIKTFSDNANGYVRGEGVGMLMLKPLEQAEQDNDHIYGVIIGSAENHGGRANSLTAPNAKAQAALLES